jgi:hypothetical protein
MVAEGKSIPDNSYSNIENLVLWASSEVNGSAVGSMTLSKIRSTKIEFNLFAVAKRSGKALSGYQ